MSCISYMPKNRENVTTSPDDVGWVSMLWKSYFWSTQTSVLYNCKRPCQVYRCISSTRVQVGCKLISFPHWLANGVVWNSDYQNCNFTHLCRHCSVLVSRYIPGGQAQPSTQSLLHVSGTDRAWQVLPQVDTQVLYSFVSSHERAVQTKQISQITLQETQVPPNSFLINISILSFPITLNSTKIAILALCCVNYTDVNPQ